PRRRSPPSGGWGKAFPPGIEPVGQKSQLLGDHSSRLAAGKPVLHCLAFERLIELTTGFDRDFFDGFHVTRFPPILCPPIRSNLTLATWKSGDRLAFSADGTLIGQLDNGSLQILD